jgi:hypothetical protein
MGDASHTLADLEALALEAADGFRCEREGVGHRLELWGRLPADWAGNLGLHFYAAGIQVVAGDALRTHDGPWVARFLVETSDPRAPLRHDFLTMARRAPRLVPPLPAPFVSISVRPSLESPGSAYASVRGKDSIGLIAHLLDHFARFGLRPRRFVIRTREDEVDDWFWLDPVTAPSSRVAPIEDLEREWSGSPVEATPQA